jgi:hypothetical protein
MSEDSLRGAVVKALCGTAIAWDDDRIVDQIQKLKDRVEELISERNSLRELLDTATTRHAEEKIKMFKLFREQLAELQADQERTAR